MMRRCIAVLVLLSVALFSTPRAGANDNDDFRQVLGELRSLNEADFGQVVSWSRSNAAPPPFVFDPAQAAEYNIMGLRPENREPLLAWLRGRGRSSLYGLHLTDADIGPNRNGLDGGQAPSPWRELTLATATLVAAPAGNITIVRGLAAAKRDGTAISACVTFRNSGVKIANRIVFEFPLLGEDSVELGVLTLDRRGTFSPGTDIVGYQQLADFNGNTIGPRGRTDNCVTQTSGIAALPILLTRFASYRITRVEYTDATVWIPGSP